MRHNIFWVHGELDRSQEIMPCGCNKNKSADNGGNAGATICVKCLTFWVLVALLAFGVLLHRHKPNGEVYF